MAEPIVPEEKKINNTHDKEFDPSAEMMVNDFDDERTLDEEEALEGSEDPQTELSNLQKEGDMPLEDLLAMYGYAEGGESSGSSQCEEEVADMEEQDEVETCSEVEEQPPEHNPIHYSELQQLYEDELTVTINEHGAPRSQGSDGEEEEEEDYEYSPDEDDEWKKTIMVGPDFQAAIPEGLCQYDDALPYENEDKLLWEPSQLTAAQADDYLVKAQEPLATAIGVNAIPTGSHVKDDEQALYLLLQCGYNIEEALRRRRMNVVTPTDTMSLWSEEECRNFENGLRLYGKDFHLIQQNKVRTRSVGELVQFYYLWKKTERHDAFANRARLEKKKYTLHPGITGGYKMWVMEGIPHPPQGSEIQWSRDYMDRLLDDQDSVGPPRDRSLSPMTHCLIYGDPKRQQRAYSGINESNGGSGSHTLLSTLTYNSNESIISLTKQFHKDIV
jgi:hypothetical protein